MKMKKLWRSRKALSPVIAAIILIAVTVAVSIAVAAWMGALTFTWMGTDELTIATLTWTGPNTGFSIKVDNTGTRDQTITQIQVNYGTTGVTQPTGLPLQLAAAGTTTLAVTFAYTNGTSYDISIVTSGGYKFTDHFTGGQDKVG